MTEIMRKESALSLPHRNPFFESMRQFCFSSFFSDIYIDCGLSPRVKLSVLEPEIGIYRGFDDGKGTVGNDAGRTVEIVSYLSCSAR